MLNHHGDMKLYNRYLKSHGKRLRTMKVSWATESSGTVLYLCYYFNFKSKDEYIYSKNVSELSSMVKFWFIIV